MNGIFALNKNLGEPLKTIDNGDGTCSLDVTFSGETVKAQLQDNNGAAIVLGQANASDSVPVVFAKDQSPQTYSSKLKIEPKFTPIAISSTSAYATLYSYSGSGRLIGFTMEFSAGRAVVKIVVDGNTMIDGNDVSTLNGLLSSSYNAARVQSGSGIVTQASNIDFSFKYPIRFNSSVVISAKLSGGASLNFQQGMFYVEKET